MNADCNSLGANYSPQVRITGLVLEFRDVAAEDSELSQVAYVSVSFEPPPTSNRVGSEVPEVLFRLPEDRRASSSGSPAKFRALRYDRRIASSDFGATVP